MTELPRDFRAQAYLMVDAQIDYWQNDFAELCESPIEIAFGVAFMAVGYHEAGQAIILRPEHAGLSLSAAHIKRFIRAQRKIGSYRVDFLLSLSAEEDADPRTAVIVECDGHDYHERTKEQAAKDRSRDRDLQTMGYKVFRFTGSELYQDAFKCAREVHHQLWRMEVGADK